MFALLGVVLGRSKKLFKESQSLKELGMLWFFGMIKSGTNDLCGESGCVQYRLIVKPRINGGAVRGL